MYNNSKCDTMSVVGYVMGRKDSSGREGSTDSIIIINPCTGMTVHFFGREESQEAI